MKAPEWYQKLHEDHRDIARAKRVTILNTKRFFLHVFFFIRAVIRYGFWNVITFVPRLCWLLAFRIGRGVYESVTGTYLSADDAFQKFQDWTVRQIKQTAWSAWKNIRYPYYYTKIQSQRGVLATRRTIRQLRELDFISLVLLTPFVFIRLGQATVWLLLQILKQSILIPIRVTHWLAVSLGKLTYHTAHWTGIIVVWCWHQFWIEVRGAWIQFKRGLLRIVWMLPGTRTAEALLSFGATFVAAFVVLGKLIPWSSRWDIKLLNPFALNRGDYAGSQLPWVFSTVTGILAIICLLLSFSDWTPEQLWVRVSNNDNDAAIETKPETIPEIDTEPFPVVVDIGLPKPDEPQFEPTLPLEPLPQPEPIITPVEEDVFPIVEFAPEPEPQFDPEPFVEVPFEPTKPNPAPAEESFIPPVVDKQPFQPKPEPNKFPFPAPKEPIVANDPPLDPEFMPEPVKVGKPNLELGLQISTVMADVPFTKVAHSFFVDMPKIPKDDWAESEGFIPKKEKTIQQVSYVRSSAKVESKTTILKPSLKLEATIPGPAAIGDHIRIHYRVENTGKTTAEKVEIRTDVPKQFSHPKGNRVRYRIGKLEPGEIYETYIYLKAEKVGKVVHHSRAVCSDATFEDIVRNIEATKTVAKGAQRFKPPEKDSKESQWAASSDKMPSETDNQSDSSQQRE